MPLGLDIVAPHGGEHARRLLAAHHRDARIRPGEQEARRIGAPAHAVIAGAVGAADDERDLRHLRAGDRGHHLGAVLGDAARLVFAADHEARDVLQEQQRDAALAAQLDEMRAPSAPISENRMPLLPRMPTGMPSDMREARHQRRAVELLELVELRTVDQSRDDLAHVVLRRERRPARCRRARPDRRAARAASRSAMSACLRRVEVGDDAPRDRQRVVVVVGVVIGDAGLARMHIGAAEILGRHDLAGRRLHQRRAAEKDRALIAHDDGLVRHRRHIGAAGRARAHHDGDLRNAGRRHVRLVEEDAAEMLAVGKHLGLVRQVGAAGIDQIDARQPVLARDLLRAQMLLHRHRIIGAALDRRIVADDHAFAALDAPDAGDDAGAVDRRRHTCRWRRAATARGTARRDRSARRRDRAAAACRARHAVRARAAARPQPLRRVAAATRRRAPACVLHCRRKQNSPGRAWKSELSPRGSLVRQSLPFG